MEDSFTLGAGPPLQPQLDPSGLTASTYLYQFVLLKLVAIAKPFFCGALKSTAHAVQPFIEPLLHSSQSLASAVDGIATSCTSFCSPASAITTPPPSIPPDPAPRLTTPYTAEEIYRMGFMYAGSAGLFWQTPACYNDPARLQAEEPLIVPVTEYISYVLLPIPDFVDPYCQLSSSVCQSLSNASGNARPAEAAEGALLAQVGADADSRSSGSFRDSVRVVLDAGLGWLSVVSALVCGWLSAVSALVFRWLSVVSALVSGRLFRVLTCLFAMSSSFAQASIRGIELSIRLCSGEWLIAALHPVHLSLCRLGVRLCSVWSASIHATIRGLQLLEWLLPTHISTRRSPSWDESLLATWDGWTWRWAREGATRGMTWLGIGVAKWILTVIGTFLFLKKSWLYILKHFDHDLPSDHLSDTGPPAPPSSRVHSLILNLEGLSIRPILYWSCVFPLHLLVWRLCAGSWQDGASSLLLDSDDALTDLANGTHADLTAKGTDADGCKAAAPGAPPAPKAEPSSAGAAEAEDETVVAKQGLAGTEKDVQIYRPHMTWAGTQATLSKIPTNVWQAYSCSGAAPFGPLLRENRVATGIQPACQATSPPSSNAGTPSSTENATGYSYPRGGSMWSVVVWRECPPAITFERAETELPWSSPLWKVINDDSDSAPNPLVEDVSVDSVDTAVVALGSWKAHQVHSLQEMTSANIFFLGNTAMATGTTTATHSSTALILANAITLTTRPAHAKATALITRTAHADNTAIIIRTAHANAGEAKHASLEYVPPAATKPEPQAPAPVVVTASVPHKDAHASCAAVVATGEKENWAMVVVEKEEKRVSSGYSFTAESLVGAKLKVKDVAPAVVVGTAEEGVVGEYTPALQAVAVVSRPVRRRILAAPTSIADTLVAVARAAEDAEDAEARTVKVNVGSAYSFTADTLSNATMSMAADPPPARVEGGVESGVARGPNPLHGGVTAAQERYDQQIVETLEELLCGQGMVGPEARAFIANLTSGLQSAPGEARKMAVGEAPAATEKPKESKKKKKKSKKKNKKKKGKGKKKSGAEGEGAEV